MSRTLSGDERGFSLVEMLVVLTIMALIAGVVTTQVVDYLAGARVKTAKTQMKNISAALDLYKIDMGKYPDQNEGLDALINKVSSSTRWNGPYLAARQVPLDPWDHPYQYKMVDAKYELLSFGADNLAGGEGESQDILAE